MIYDKAKQNHSGEKIARSSDQRWFGGFVIRTFNNVRGKLWRQSFISPLTLRILAVNIVALLIPIGFLFYSDFHRDGLINAELEVMSNKGKLIAAALGETSVGETHLGKQFINPIMARDIIRRLGDDPNLPPYPPAIGYGEGTLAVAWTQRTDDGFQVHLSSFKGQPVAE